MSAKTIEIEVALRVLYKVATNEIRHANMGLCPDELEGHSSRDPDYPACKALIAADKVLNKAN